MKEGITDDELSRLKNAIRVGYYTRLESNSGIRESLSQAESAGTCRDLLDAPRRRSEAVTREDVSRVAKQYLVKESRSVLLTTRKGAGSGEGMPRRRPGGPPAPGAMPGAPPAPAAAPAPEVKG
ncbi:MAG: insulinase family protein [Holophagales bacterium]|nr:insulinase family protein [Holophagales bacterium]